MTNFQIKVVKMKIELYKKVDMKKFSHDFSSPWLCQQWGCVRLNPPNFPDTFDQLAAVGTPPSAETAAAFLIALAHHQHLPLERCGSECLCWTDLVEEEAVVKLFLGREAELHPVVQGGPGLEGSHCRRGDCRGQRLRRWQNYWPLVHYGSTVGGQCVTVANVFACVSLILEESRNANNSI